MKSWLVGLIASLIALLLVLVIAWVIWWRLTRIPPVPYDPEATLGTEPDPGPEFENPVECDSELFGDEYDLNRAFEVVSESSE
jgi:hypothetical protein